MSEPWGNLILAAVVFLIVGVAGGILKIFAKERSDSRLARLQRERFWNAIPALASVLAAERASRYSIQNWRNVLEGFHAAGYTLEDTKDVVRTFVTLFRDCPKTFDFADWLKRKNAWAIQTFGPGDAADRVAGISDHIRKELDELAKAPNDLEEWIDLIFLATDGAWRTGATERDVTDALEHKLMKNMARTWPDWRTAEPGEGD